MSRDAFLSSEDFGLKIYNKFPPMYREDDAKVNYALKRYLQSVGDGGFKYAIDEWNGILNIYNPSNIDSNMLSILYEQFGFDLFYGIPEEYLRYLLPRLSEAWKKKGSLDVVEYVVYALSGIKTTTEVHTDSQDNILLDVRLEMDFAMGSFFPDPSQFKRILDKFIPYYVDSTLIYSYVFYESQKVWLAENYFFNEIKENTHEFAFIPYDVGTRYVPVLNQLSYVLNNNLYTNGTKTFDVDPDTFVDNVKSSFAESQGFRKQADDYFSDTIILTFTDEIGIKDEDSHTESMVFNLADDNTIRAFEDITADSIILKNPDVDIPVLEDMNKGNDLYQGLFTNISESVLNDAGIVIPDVMDKIYYTTTGVTVLAFPTLHKYVEFA